MELNRKKNILVLGVGGNVSTGILKTIKNSDINVYTFGACVQKYAAGFALCDKALLSPYANSKNFLPWLNKTILNHDIDVVLSGVEEINTTLANSNTVNKKCLVLVPDKNYIETFSDKLTTIQWLKDKKIDYPKTEDLGKQSNFSYLERTLTVPFIVKPKIGKSSVDLLIIENEEQFKSIKNKKLFIAQQLIGDDNSEYTCGIYKSRYGYTEIIVMRRFLKNGSTIMAEVEDNKVVYDYCKQIADAINTTGPFNIQLRLCKNTHKPFCFEVNMRLSGTTAIRHNFGFKDCQVWIKENLFDESFHHNFNIKSAIAIRYEAEVYLDKITLESLDIDQH